MQAIFCAASNLKLLKNIFFSGSIRWEYVYFVVCQNYFRADSNDFGTSTKNI